MIYTIGYQRLSPARLQEIVHGLGATLIDVRHKPRSRIPGYNMSQLSQRFHERYIPMGDLLGGSGNVKVGGIGRLLQYDRERKPILLMCMEEAPGECHRHHDICGQYFPDAIHIFQDELITVREFRRSVLDDDEYEIDGSLNDLIAELSKQSPLVPT